MKVYAEHGLKVDAREVPLVTIVFPSDVDEPGYAWLAKIQEKLVEGSELPIAWLVELDGYDVRKASPAARQAAATRFDQNKHRLAAGTLCEARVVSNMLIRNVATAFDWLTNSPWPRRNFSSRVDALRWIDELRGKTSSLSPLAGDAES